MKKHICTVVIAILMAVLTATLSPIQIFAASKKQYISEIRMSDSQDKLTELGYTVLDNDLNFSTGNGYSYIGYKTTDNPDEAITDISIMDMKGGYSYGDYEAMLGQQKKAVAERTETYRIAINEFAERYNAGSKAALIAFESLNGFIEDDSSKLIGDMLIDPALSDDDLIKMFMQGTMLLNSLIADCLAIGLAQDGDGNWLSRIGENEATTLDAFDDVILLTDSIGHLCESLNEYLDSELKLSDRESDPDEFADLTDDEYLNLIDIGVIYETLSLYHYKDGTVADLFLTEDYETEDYYPLIAALTPGQLAIAQICGFKSLIKAATASDSIWEDANAFSEDLTEEIFGEEDKQKVSIYTGVDRDMYKGGVALTNDAMRKSSSTGDNSWWRSNINVQAETALGISAVLAGVLSAAFYSSCSSYAATVATLDAAAAADGFVSMYARTMTHANSWGVEYGSSYTTFSANQMNTLAYSRTMMGVANVAMWISAAIVFIAIATFIGLKIHSYYNPEYTEIPLVLMDLKFGEDDEIGDWEKYIKYNVVLNEGGTAGDLNGFAAKQWNAMYVTKDRAAGNPILADSFAVQYGDSTTPRNYSPVHYFGSADAFNLNSHCYDDLIKGIFMFFRSDDTAFASETASVFGTGALAVVTGFGGLVIGALGAIFITKKKKETVAEA